VKRLVVYCEWEFSKYIPHSLEKDGVLCECFVPVEMIAAAQGLTQWTKVENSGVENWACNVDVGKIFRNKAEQSKAT
jgi:hypothetical protein